MRLDKALSGAGHGTRREMRMAVRDGRVTVDGITAKQLDMPVHPAEQCILLDGETIDWQPFYTLMLHKPAGVVSSTEEPGETTVLDILPPRWKRVGLFPAGRLDKDSTGLLLLTNDGVFAHWITSPNHDLEKRYLVTVLGKLSEKHREDFAHGVTLKDGTMCRPASLEILSANDETSQGIVTLKEGKYHQIKRMMAACHCKVTALHRFAIGSVELDKELDVGNWRKLTDFELKYLK